MRVFYKWLEGIYKNNNHFYIWWFDTDTPEDDQFLKIYNGLRLYTVSLKLILNDVRFNNVNLPISEPWVTHLSLVFLEHIIQS